MPHVANDVRVAHPRAAADIVPEAADLLANDLGRRRRHARQWVLRLVTGNHGARLVGDDNELRPVPGTQFGQQATDVRLDGSQADEQGSGDLGVGPSRSDLDEDFQLAFGERGAQSIWEIAGRGWRPNSAMSRRVTAGASRASPRATILTASRRSSGRVSLSTKPLAPPRRAAKTCSSWSKVVTTRTRGAAVPLSAAMTRVAGPTSDLHQGRLGSGFLERLSRDGEQVVPIASGVGAEGALRGSSPSPHRGSSLHPPRPTGQDVRNVAQRKRIGCPVKDGGLRWNRICGTRSATSASGRWRST